MVIEISGVIKGVLVEWTQVARKLLRMIFGEMVNWEHVFRGDFCRG
jgi:hypothetical protein